MTRPGSGRCTERRRGRDRRRRTGRTAWPGWSREGRPVDDLPRHNSERLVRLLAQWEWQDEKRNGPKREPLGDRERIIQRARLYIAKEPPAVSGEKGHNSAFHVACV